MRSISRKRSEIREEKDLTQRSLRAESTEIAEREESLTQRRRVHRGFAGEEKTE
jgi:hypothetical protein